MFKLNMHVFPLYNMSLSKKNIDKLNNFIKNKNLINDCASGNTHNINNNHKSFKKPSKLEDPNEIFYSLIDNSETLDQTCETNHLLINSEKKYLDLSSKKSDYPNNLTTEDELYDEFNYLLDE